MPNDEGNPKFQWRRQNLRPGGKRFDIRTLSFFRHSSFGFRHCPEPPHVGCYKGMNDLKFALRQLLKHPGFTALTVLTLALGIGANTAIFSAIDAALLRLLPVWRPGQLRRLEWSARRTEFYQSYNGSMRSN